MDSEPGLSRVVGIGASVGGIDALIQIVGALSGDLPAAICIVLHVPANGRSLLADILARWTELPVSVARSGEPVRPGRIYVAPPDRHLTVSAGQMWLGRGPKVHGVRPAADPMPHSLASAWTRCWSSRVVLGRRWALLGDQLTQIRVELQESCDLPIRRLRLAHT